MGTPSGPEQVWSALLRVLALDVGPDYSKIFHLLRPLLVALRLHVCAQPAHHPFGQALGTTPPTEHQFCPRSSGEMQSWSPLPASVTNRKVLPLTPCREIRVSGTHDPRGSTHHSSPPTAFSEANRGKWNTAKPNPLPHWSNTRSSVAAAHTSPIYNSLPFPSVYADPPLFFGALLRPTSS